MKDLCVFGFVAVDIPTFCANPLSGAEVIRCYLYVVHAKGVDVWCMRLDEAHAPAFAEVLSPAEHERAVAFRSDIHRNKFETARGVLRILLGRYLGIDARGLEFEYGSHGKPFIRSDAGLQFNIAHSGDMVLYALSNLEVGIDIEQERKLADMMGIARRFFSVAEARELSTLAGVQRAHAFHRCWARKEAYIKALGLGLSLPLESFRVSLLPGEPARLKEILGNPGLEAEWLIRDLPVTDGYAAALAVRSREIELWTSPVLNAVELTSMMVARQI